MKKTLLLIAILCLSLSCKESVQQESTVYEPKIEKLEHKQLYNVGDVVYLKPDSIKGVIIRTHFEYDKPAVIVNRFLTNKELKETEVELTCIYCKE